MYVLYPHKLCDQDFWLVAVDDQLAIAPVENHVEEEPAYGGETEEVLVGGEVGDAQP